MGLTRFQKGFTLIELMIVISIGAVIFTLIAAAIGVAIYFLVV